MGRREFPALGFDPAPGEPGAVESARHRQGLLGEHRHRRRAVPWGRVAKLVRRVPGVAKGLDAAGDLVTRARGIRLHPASGRVCRAARPARCTPAAQTPPRVLPSALPRDEALDLYEREHGLG